MSDLDIEVTDEPEVCKLQCRNWQGRATAVDIDRQELRLRFESGVHVESLKSWCEQIVGGSGL